MEKCICPTCNATVEPVTPRAPGLVLVALWICGILTMIACSIPLLGLVFLPLMFVVAWGIATAASRSAVATCPVCRAEIARPAVEPNPLRGPLVPHPA